MVVVSGERARMPGEPLGEEEIVGRAVDGAHGRVASHVGRVKPREPGDDLPGAEADLHPPPGYPPAALVAEERRRRVGYSGQKKNRNFLLPATLRAEEELTAGGARGRRRRVRMVP